MSDREFENYLTLLAGLLRLSGKQREAIAEELRSHLEDRLEELMAGGVSREEAVKQALAEFGDAAGVAGQFATVSRNRKRRWLVRVMTFSVAATLLIAASLVIFWPGRNAAPGRATAHAQFGAAAPGLAGTQIEPPKDQAAARKSLQSAADRIESELSKEASVDFVEQPLKDVMLMLAENHNIPIVLSQKKLEEASVSPDTPITKTLRGIQLRSVLRLILKDLELTYVVRDEVLQITTPEDAESQLVIRVYDCRDLLAMQAPAGADKFVPRARAGQRGGGPGLRGGPGEPGGKASDSAGEKDRERPVSEHDLRAERLMNIIMTSVKADSWDEVGGPGSISEYNGLIVVTQTDEVHETVERVFDMLRQAAGLEAAKGTKVVR